MSFLNGLQSKSNSFAPGNTPPAAIVTSLTAAQAEQRVMADFMDAFMRVSGLPLELSGKECPGSNCFGMKISGFCQLIHEANSPIIRQQCGLFNSKLEKMAVNQPHSARCFAGIHLTAVPVQNGSEHVEYFKTGIVMPDRPAARDFAKVMHQLSAAGLETLTQKAKKAWLAIPVMEHERYRASVDILAAFTRKIAGNAREDEVDSDQAGSLLMREAQRYIEKNSAKQLKFTEVAQAVGLSPNYFCSKFRDFTGLTFTNYLAGIRVACAARLLSEPSRRIKEIAYDTGFNSISQFNRVFHAVTGASPTAYRLRGGAYTASAG
jgi:AraC-like DNA-binding protein/ligand-binding sensor protein